MSLYSIIKKTLFCGTFFNFFVCVAKWVSFRGTETMFVCKKICLEFDYLFSFNTISDYLILLRRTT